MSVHYNITANNDDFKRKFAEVRSEIRNSEVTAQNASANIQSSIKKMAVGMGGLLPFRWANRLLTISRESGNSSSLKLLSLQCLAVKSKQTILCVKRLILLQKRFDLNQVASGYKQLLAYGIGVEAK